MSAPVPADLRTLVVARAKGRCEYCHVPEIGVLLRHELDHVIARQHGGETHFENLAFACFHRNRQKGTNVATVGSGAAGMVRLFNPRLDDWKAHFKQDGVNITGRSEIGERNRAAAALEFAPTDGAPASAHGLGAVGCLGMC